ncbi:galactokinase [Arthrobacter sp. JSM 101049]|uniref:galactokinase n=1 Tax=Arthrobacter sp. JSM 101049 TaxID=929097 RepID=UPI0035625A5B
MTHRYDDGPPAPVRPAPAGAWRPTAGGVPDYGAQTARITQAFTALFGGLPDGVWAAPGRVNLMGEHTDYNEGFVLPFALEHTARVAVALCRTGPPRLRTASLQGTSSGTGTVPTASPITEADLGHLEPGAVAPWARYVAGVIWALQQRGHQVPGVDILLDSDVPAGAGLSSSAAIECAVALALDELLATGIGREELVLACQQAENDFVGAPTGILDQSAALLGTAGHALFLDCRSRAARQVPLPLADAGLTLLVIDTRVAHAHESGGYKDLVAACRRGAAALGVPALRDVGPDRLDDARLLLDPETFRRVRHIVTENQRVLDVVGLLDAGGPGGIGPLLSASHASMRDDFGISCPELDAAVEAAQQAGARGARMTGGGFGGSAIAVVAAQEAGQVGDAVRRRFAEDGYAEPGIASVLPGPGARRIDGR